jgi:ankyrin repeat protein
MKDRFVVSLEERMFNDLNTQAKKQDNISPLLQSILHKLQNILLSLKILAQDEDISEEDSKFLEITKTIQLHDKSGQDRVDTEAKIINFFYNKKQQIKNYALFELRPLLLKAAILLDDIESVRIIVSNIEEELNNHITLLNKKINYSIIAKYAIDKKYLDLLDYPKIYEAVEKNLFKDIDYKLKVYFEDDADIIKKFTAKNPNIFTNKVASERMSMHDLVNLYYDTIDYITYEYKKDPLTKKRMKIQRENNPFSFFTPSIIKDNIFKLNIFINKKNYNIYNSIDIKLMDIFTQINPNIFQNLTQSEKNYILLQASKNKQFYRKSTSDFIDFVLTNGADLEAKDNNGYTALHCSVSIGNIEMAKLLLEKGADIDAKDFNGNTPLLSEVAKGNIEIVKFLLEKGADIDVKDLDGNTPLVSEVAKGNIEIVKLLVEKNANIEAKDALGSACLYYAVITGNIEMAKYLLEKGANIDATNSSGNSSLHLAAIHGNIEMVKLLLEKNPNIDISCDLRKTPLHYATEQGHIEIVKLLLEKNPNIDLSCISEMTPLHYATNKGHIEIVKLLLEKNANIDLSCDLRKTPLHYATNKGHIEIVKLLLEKNANIDLSCNLRKTPLHYATEQNNIEMVKLLLEKNPNIDISCISGKTPLHYAIVIRVELPFDMCYY